MADLRLENPPTPGLPYCSCRMGIERGTKDGKRASMCHFQCAPSMNFGLALGRASLNVIEYELGFKSIQKINLCNSFGHESVAIDFRAC